MPAVHVRKPKASCQLKQHAVAAQHQSALKHLTLRNIQASQASVLSYMPMAVCGIVCTSSTAHLRRGDRRAALAGGRTGAWEPAARMRCGRMRARRSCMMHSTYEFRGIRGDVCVYANAFWYCFVLRACHPNPRTRHPHTHVCCGVDESMSQLVSAGYKRWAITYVHVLV